MGPPSSSPPLRTSEAIGIFTDRPSVLEALREDVQTVRSTLYVLYGVEGTDSLSHPTSAIVYIALKSGAGSSGLLERSRN
jgi:hypothetical protein